MIWPRKSFYMVPNQAPVLEIYESVLFDMLEIVKHCPVEVSWLGYVTQIDSMTYRLEQVTVPGQDCTPTTTNIQPSDMEELLEKFEPVRGSYRLWGHSHVNMEVFASGVDTPTFAEEYQAIEKRPNPFFFMLILNKRGDYHLELKTPQFHAYHVPVTIISNQAGCGTPAEDWSVTVKEKVRMKYPAKVLKEKRKAYWPAAFYHKSPPEGWDD